MSNDIPVTARTQIVLDQKTRKVTKQSLSINPKRQSILRTRAWIVIVKVSPTDQLTDKGQLSTAQVELLS